jgi:hypothetical protein
MKDTFEYVSLLLKTDELLRGYPGYPNLKKALASEIGAVERYLEPGKVEEIPTTRVFPADSGVVEKETTPPEAPVEEEHN